MIITLRPSIVKLGHTQRAVASHSVSLSGMAAPLDLGALRREREARHAQKRQRSISPPERSRKAPKLDSDTVTLPNGARLTSFSSVVNNEQDQRKSSAANAANAQHKSLDAVVVTSTVPGASLPMTLKPLEFPDGVIKKTWAFRHDRTGDDIKLEEVLEPNTLCTAVLSAFQWDLDWIFTKIKTPINGGTTKCVFVMQAKEAALQSQMRQETQHMSQWLRLCFPPMEGQTRCMHSKLMLLFHEHKLRIAVPSANLLNFDWGETGSMENSVFLIDLPRLAGTVVVATAFQTELSFFIRSQGLQPDVVKALDSFDFSATKDMAFVHSIGGIAAGPNSDRSGLASLARAVRDLGLANKSMEIDFAASSIGKLNDQYLHLVHAATCGEDVFAASAQFGARKASQFFQKGGHTDGSIRDKIRIYFPTSDTVKASTAGAAGTICLSRDWFEDMSFPRRCFRDYISARPGLLSHNKILYARSASSSEQQTAWLYHGSANVSESAWGKLVLNKKEKTWHVNCRNWECGVLLPVKPEVTTAAGKEKRLSGDGLVDMKAFDGIMKPPFKYPGTAYGDREPWYFNEANLGGNH